MFPDLIIKGLVHIKHSDGIGLYKPVAANDMLKRAEVSFGQLEVPLIDYDIPNPTKFIALIL